MITFKTVRKKLILSYDFSDSLSNFDWVRRDLEESGDVLIKKTFAFSKDDLYKGRLGNDEDFDNLMNDIKPVNFVLGNLENEYFKIKNDVILHKMNLYIHKDLELSRKYFIAENDVSIFRKIEELITEDIYIGGNHPNAISEIQLKAIIKDFPNSYEKKKYAQARLSTVIKEYFETTKDAQSSFDKYLKKKVTRKGENLLKTFKDIELLKYQAILSKLKIMLAQENTYSENQWQDEIIQIIRLLYPKYIFVFKEVKISADDIRDKFLDILLVDSNGNIDILEIKKPFENAIMTKSVYRDNYIPLKELAGTVMQIEKYIYYLNRAGIAGERKLTQKYRDMLPQDFNLKITNPGGIIIMGRENKLSPEQKQDFEVVKRKYKNVVDIITYDDLLKRLEFTIQQIKTL